ncbi:MAG: lysylphosphatidylglycerol synthase transmembrane domain-containing protein [Candidatus Magasanikbacteria bacterium]|nr:lysylphosphatidylglycerol synthase transmembrane domain-containing protein [Candidatus Magasanikbacteria bacterium]
MKILNKPIFKIFVSVVLFAFIFWKIDKFALISSFKLLDLRYIPLIIALLVVNYVVSSIRWKSLLIYPNTKHITVTYLTGLYFMGSFFNNFMPTSIGGDVFKVYKLGKKIGDTTNAFSATFMERFTGVMALFLISSGALIYFLKFWGVVLFVAFWVGLIVGLFMLKFLSTKIKLVKKVYDSLMFYKGQNKVLVIALLTSFIVQFATIFTQFFVFSALGVHIPIFYALFMFPIIVLASFFIPSLNGMGVQDSLYILLFGGATYISLFGGVSAGAAVALSASIIFHLSKLLVSLFGGILYAAGKAD